MNTKAFFVALAVGIGAPSASATVTAFFSAGSDCNGPNSTSFTTSGPSFPVSLCVTTTSESVCGATIQLQSANSAEDGRFKITNRSLPSSGLTDANVASLSYPISITNPRQTVDFGATVTSGTPPPPGANQLLATFTIQPQSTATNNSYVISTSSLSSIASDNSNCFQSPADLPISASLTLNKSGPIANVPTDFNSDTKPDFLLRHTGSGNTFVWYMNGSTFVSDQLIGGISPPWTVVGTGDFNGDGKTDLVVRNLTSGSTFVWYMNGATLVADAPLFTIDPIWQIVGVADFNSDGKPDIVFRNSSNGSTFIWFMNNTTFISDQFVASIASPWAIVGTADFNSDGKTDLLIRNTSTGTAFVWYMNGATLMSDAQIFSVDPIWKVKQVADFNGDGKPDIVFRHSSTGTAFVWHMNNTTFVSDQFLFTVDPVWDIVP